jgi:hypothetical protein
MLPDAKRAKLDGIYEEMEDTARWALGAKRLPREHAPVPTGSKGGQKRYAPLPGALRARCPTSDSLTNVCIPSCGPA